MGSSADIPATTRLRRARQDLRALPRQFWLLALGFFVLIAGIDMCFPFETTYLHGRLGASMTTIGLMLGLPALVALPMHIVTGAITDRYGRKPVMAIGACLLITLYLTFAFATGLWQIGIAVAAEATFGWAMFLTGSNAMIADLIPFERRAEAYSITRVAMHVGMVLGPLVAGLLIVADPTYRTLFLTGVSVCSVFLLILLGFFRETKPSLGESRGSILTTLAGYKVVLRDRRFLAFCAIAVLPLYGFGQIWSTFPVVLRNEHSVSPSTWGQLLAFYAFCVAVLQYPVIRTLRHRNHLLLLAAASALIAIGLTGTVLAPWGWPALVFVFVLGQGVVLFIPISATVAAELAPVALRGRYMGAWTLVQTGGFALGPTFGGWAMDALGNRGAFALLGAVGLTGAGLFALTASRLAPPHRSGEAGAEQSAAQTEVEAETTLGGTLPGA